jgi:hypothetical protein
MDGEIGKVLGFLVDPADNHVTHILLQEGHLWGRKEVSIPFSAVIGVDAGIRLNITKKQVEDLPRLADLGEPRTLLRHRLVCLTAPWPGVLKLRA